MPSSSHTGTYIRTDPEDPDCDWNDHTELLGTAITYMAVIFIFLVIVAFKMVSLGMLTAILELRMLIILIIPNFFGLMLFSLMIEAAFSPVPQIPSRTRKFLHLAVVFMTGLSTLLPIIMGFAQQSAVEYESGRSVSYPWTHNWAGVVVVAACYPVCVIIIRFVRRSPGRSSR